MCELADTLKPLLKNLPRRIFHGDRDQSWNLSLDGPWLETRPDGRLHAMGKAVPVYQSGWEGCGIWMSVKMPEATGLPEIAAAMIEDARVKILADPMAVGFVGAS